VIKTGFGLRSPKLVFVLAAAMLGISMWPLVMSLTASWHEVYGFLFGSAKQDEWHDRLVETTSQQVARIRMVSPLVIAIAFSIVPAVCEEWFFRGMLLRSLLKTKKVWKAILISALVFGSFHVLSNSVIALDRLIPSTLIGLMLGYLAYKSNSVWPGVVLHSLNNAIVIFLAYYQPQLSKLSWFPGEEESIPYSWVAAGLVVAAMGAALVWSTRRVEDVDEKAESSSPPIAEAVS
jgi:membrane protease YdiL (CAAX protease family)